MPERNKEQPKIKETKEEKEEIFFKELISQEAANQIKEQIKTPEGLAFFEKWRGLDQEGREARKIRKAVELLTAAKSILERELGKREEFSKNLLELLNLKENIGSRLRTDQFLSLLVSEILGLEKPKVRKEVEKLVNGLKKSKSTEGELNALDLLSSPKINFDLKEEWVSGHFLPRLYFLAQRDLEEAKKVPPPPVPTAPPGKPPLMPELPPKEQDFIRPSIEETKKKEGEPTGYFTVVPFYGGYWKEEVFEEWDSQHLCFRSGLRKLAKLEKEEIDEKTERVMQGFIVGDGKTPLPCAYNFAFKPESLKTAPGTKLEILQKQEGNYILKSSQERIIPFSISLGKRKKQIRKEPKEPPVAIEIITGRLSSETEEFLEKLKKEKISPLEKARKLKYYVRNLLKYPAEGDSSYNAIYYQEPEKFFQKIEQFKKADCDVANAFFIALLSRLDIPARLVGGYYIKIKDHQGRAVFSSGSRHAWAEVWDSAAVSKEGTHWHCLDATPAGAPELDEEETDEKIEDKDFEGDFGEFEAEVLSDEEITEMIEEVKKIQAEAETKKKLPEEIRAENFIQETGCTLQEAKEILSQIEKARQLKDSQGRNILDRLSREFLKIIKENLKEISSYRAPVRLPEADELEEPVEAYLDIKTGEAEPSGFKKYEKKIIKIQEYGGFDVIFVKDKSGSMAETDLKSGKLKYQEQQTANFLLNEALHRFSQYARRNRIKLLSPLDIRFTDIGFQAGGAEAFFPLTDKWGPKEQLTVWKKSAENIGGGTPDNLGLRAAREIIERDIKETEKKKRGKSGKRLRLAIVLADGGTDSDKVRDRENEKNLLTEMGVVVAGLGLTESAKAMKVAYHPNGDCVESVSEMPEWAAKFIIKQVQKLYPKKIKK